MEMSTLESLWKEQDQKLDQVLQVNKALINKLNLREAHHKLRKPLRSEFLTLSMTLIFIVYLLTLSSYFIDLPAFSIPGFLATICAMGLVFFAANRIHSIQKSFDFKLPVSELQKHLTALQLKKLKFAKLELLLGVGAAIFMWPVVLFSGFGINVYQNLLILGITLIIITIISIPITIAYERSYRKNISSVKEIFNELDH